MNLHLMDTIPLLLLYAETHYRFFRFFPSLLYKKEPEIIFDLPRRLAPGRDLPVLLLVNDIHRFPLELQNVNIALTSHDNRTPLKIEIPSADLRPLSHPLEKTSTAFLFFVPAATIKKFASNNLSITCHGKFTNKKQILHVVNDNLFGTSKLPFTCTIATTPLPTSETTSYGDLHVHSHYSQSHVEFGPPLRVITAMATASGLDFAAITDHSYDLACSMDNYLIEDPSIPRWTACIEELRQLDTKCVTVAGEEISCKNNAGKTVHLLGLGLDRFVPGNSDGARYLLPTKNQLTVAECVQNIHTQKGVAFAAHPGARAGLIAQWLLGRGEWSTHDIECRIDGVQAVNCGFSTSWRRARDLWIHSLLAGKKIPLIAGNDAHGDFNRYRCISKPFYSIGEFTARYFGYAKTALYKKVTTQKEVLDAVLNGETFVTTGPYLSITTPSSPDTPCIGIVNVIGPSVEHLFVNIISTEEFGALREVTVYGGRKGQTKEECLFSLKYQGKIFVHSEKIDFSNSSGILYIRAETATITSDDIILRAATSPAYRDSV